MMLALTSDIVEQRQMYDLAASILQQTLSQVDGVGQVSSAAERCPRCASRSNPTALHGYGLGLEDVRTLLAAANANRPKGQLADAGRAWSHRRQRSAVQGARSTAARRRVSERRARCVSRTSRTVMDSVEDIGAGGLANGKPAVLVIVFREPGANIIDTVDRVRALLPQLRASLPPAIDLSVALDRTTTIRASVHDVGADDGDLDRARDSRRLRVPAQRARDGHPGVAVPVSLIGTFGVMYLLGYSLNNLSLMALTIATGFVVDDAIVVIENISRHLESGHAAG